MVRSPFYVVQEFLSPLLCEEIVDDLRFLVPDTKIVGFDEAVPIKTQKGHDRSEETIYNVFSSHVLEIEDHYNVEVRGTEPMMFEWYAQGCEGEDPHCENSNYLRRKWVKLRDRDLTCVLFLSDYQETVPFDSDFEVFGGKIEFPQHNFGFNPQRGTLIVFPSGPHFLNGTTPILAGDLYQVRFHIATMKQFQYNPSEWPGGYEQWLQQFA